MVDGFFPEVKTSPAAAHGKVIKIMQQLYVFSLFVNLRFPDP